MAVVVAGARPSGVDPLSPVGGVPMVARAVRCLLATGLVDDVVVLDVPARRGAVLKACSGLPVSVHDGLRSALPPLRAPLRQSGGGAAVLPSAEVVLLHDAARPLAPPSLAASVVEAVGPDRLAVVPVLPVSDTVKLVDGADLVRATPDRTGLRVLQTPHAIGRGLLDGVLADHPLAAATAHGAAGGTVHTVPGDPMAFAVRTAWDLELAQLLVGRGTQ